MISSLQPLLGSIYALAPGSVSRSEVAPLDHEVLDDAMERTVLESESLHVCDLTQA